MFEAIESFIVIFIGLNYVFYGLLLNKIGFYLNFVKCSD